MRPGEVPGRETRAPRWRRAKRPQLGKSPTLVVADRNPPLRLVDAGPLGTVLGLCLVATLWFWPAGTQPETIDRTVTQAPPALEESTPLPPELPPVATPPPAPPPKPAIVQSGPGYQVQLASLPTSADAKKVWGTLLGEYRDLLGTLTPIQSTARVLGHTVYRVRVGPLATRSEAGRLCDSLKERGADCFVVATSKPARTPGP